LRPLGDLVSVARAICNVELHAHAACPVTRVVVGHRGIFKLASAVRRSRRVSTWHRTYAATRTLDSRLSTPDSRFWKSGADSTPDSRLGVPRCARTPAPGLQSVPLAQWHGGCMGCPSAGGAHWQRPLRGQPQCECQPGVGSRHTTLGTSTGIESRTPAAASPGRLRVPQCTPGHTLPVCQTSGQCPAPAGGHPTSLLSSDDIRRGHY
jgi:hypothetical protein